MNSDINENSKLGYQKNIGKHVEKVVNLLSEFAVIRINFWNLLSKKCSRWKKCEKTKKTEDQMLSEKLFKKDGDSKIKVHYHLTRRNKKITALEVFILNCRLTLSSFIRIALQNTSYYNSQDDHIL